jgi:hypothetical protein
MQAAPLKTLTLSEQFAAIEANARAALAARSAKTLVKKTAAAMYSRTGLAIMVLLSYLS